MEIICTSSDDGLTTYFAYISGENTELAKAEVEVLLNQFITDKELIWYGRLAKIITPVNPTGFLLERAALVQMAGIILYECNLAESITDVISDDDWTTHITKQDNFSIKTQCIDGNNDLDMRLQIERALGAHIKKATGARVNLRSPSIQIQVLIMPEKILIDFLIVCVLSMMICKARELLR